MFNQKQMQKMMKEAQKLQNDMKSKQDEIENTTFEGTAGGEAVKVSMKGNYQVVGVQISDDLMDVEEKDMLEELFAVAHNDAVQKINKMTDEELGSMTQGLPF